MKRYSTIHPLFMSFYSASLYRDVGRNWKKTSFLYLLLLLAVFLIPEMFQMRSEVSDYLRSKAPEIVRQVPVITISKGRASINEPMPYIIKDPETNAALFIIDTTGAVPSLVGTEAAALLTDSRLYLKRNAAETKILELKDIDNLVIDQARIYDWMDFFMENFVVALFPFALFFSFLFRVAQALVFAGIGMLMGKNLGLSLSYGAMVSLAIVAMTPSIILTAVYEYSGAKVPFGWVIGLLVSLGYLFFAVKANSEQEPAEDAR